MASVTDLFCQGSRSYRGPKAEDESGYTYLNRSARPEAEWLRNLLEGWFQSLPEDVRKDLGQRFRSTDDRQHLGAFFELYCHALLLAQGFTVECHPAVDPQRSSRPDFKAWKEKEGVAPFIMECTLSAEPKYAHSKQARLNQLLAYLNRSLQSPHFFVFVNVRRVGAASAPGRDIRCKLERWMQTLDPDSVALRSLGRALEGLPRYSWQDGDWHLEFDLIPKKPEARGMDSLRPIGGLAQLELRDPRQSLLNALKIKSSKYGSCPYPYVVSVALTDLFVDENDEKEALFGSSDAVHYVSARRRGGSGDSDGFWKGPDGSRNQMVSAALVCRGVHPWMIESTTGVLWHNPWAARALDFSTWRGPQRIFNTETKEMVPVHGAEFSVLLGIPRETKEQP